MRSRSTFIITLASATLLAATTALTASAQQPQANPTPAPTPAPQTPAPVAKPRLEIGKPAPSFTLHDTEGESVALEDFEGRILVIEWLHPGCEASRHQHTTGALRTLPGLFEADDVAWIAINSVSSASEFGGTKPSVAARDELAIDYPLLVDEAGTVATLYGMSVSPSVVVIDAEGLVRYVGAVDNAPAGVLPEGEPRIDYLAEALVAVIDATAIEHAVTTPTGCDIRPKAKKAS